MATEATGGEGGTTAPALTKHLHFEGIDGKRELVPV